MAHVPKEYESMIALARAELAKVSKQKGPAAILRQVYESLIEEFIKSGADPEEFNPTYNLYLAKNLTRVLSRIQAISLSYPPTKRKGVGTDGGVTNLSPGEWIFPHTGSKGSPTGGDDDDDIDDNWEGGGVFDWAPAAEISRAQAMLNQVAEEIGFGMFDNALDFVRAVAQRLGGRWGLNGKRGNPNDPSTDLLAWDIPGHPPQTFDVIFDSGGQNKIVWQPLPYGPKAVWIKP
jgi:hypothetical protein